MSEEVRSGRHFGSLAKRPPAVLRAGPADAPAIAEVLREAFREYEALYTAEAFAATVPGRDEIVLRMDEGPIWLARHEASTIGTVAVVPRGEALYIRGMAAVPAARGVGVGKALLREVEAFASAHGYGRLLLSTTPFLTLAIGLYERMGFERTDAGPTDLHGTPLFTMEKSMRAD